MQINENKVVTSPIFLTAHTQMRDDKEAVAGAFRVTGLVMFSIT
jgi:hypothetical protein